MRAAVLALLALLAPAALGQAVTGRVTDAETGAPVIGAAVRAADRGVAANADGDFLLTLPEAGTCQRPSPNGSSAVMSMASGARPTVRLHTRHCVLRKKRVLPHWQ